MRLHGKLLSSTSLVILALNALAPQGLLDWLRARGSDATSSRVISKKAGSQANIIDELRWNLVLFVLTTSLNSLALIGQWWYTYNSGMSLTLNNIESLTNMTTMQTTLHPSIGTYNFPRLKESPSPLVHHDEVQPWIMPLDDMNRANTGSAECLDSLNRICIDFAVIQRSCYASSRDGKDVRGWEAKATV